MGTDSVFEWLYKKNALWISLNLDLNRGCAIHHMKKKQKYHVNSIKYSKANYIIMVNIKKMF